MAAEEVVVAAEVANLDHDSKFSQVSKSSLNTNVHYQIKNAACIISGVFIFENSLLF